jgi:hypothetical protein
MAQNDSTTFIYESARHKALMDEYAKLSSHDEFAEWGKKAPAVAAYMNQTLTRVALGIKHEKTHFDQEKDKKQKQGIKMATMQLENFHTIVKKQLDHLIKVMESLPSGSVRAEYEELIKPWSPKADTPYIKIRVGKYGDVAMDGKITNLELLRDALGKLAQVDGLVLYSREVAEGVEVPKVAEDIIRSVIDNRLPIRLCEQADFSDAIDEDGKLRIGE